VKRKRGRIGESVKGREKRERKEAASGLEGLRPGGRNGETGEWEKELQDIGS